MKNVTFAELIEKIEGYINDAKALTKINDAYEYAARIQENYTRSDKNPLINHSLSVAYILTELNVDVTTIVAALVHECVIKCKSSVDEIQKLFGSDVALIVENLARIDKLKLTDESDSSSLYLRKILVGLSEDVRVIVIKLADRLSNMETIYRINGPLQKRKITETKTVLIPIAHRLGINTLKSKLEDYWLKYSKPDVYEDILQKLDDSREELDQLIVTMKEDISELLNSHDIPFKIKGRVKSVYSIYEKLLKGKRFSDIYDILALRLILENPEDCYSVVGLLHAKYRPIPKRFKDFIAMPKANMYQSLHTTVFGTDGHLFEIQLRTADMDEIAEHGIASHWSYKEHGALKTQNIMEQKLELFRALIENASSDEMDLNRQFENEFLSSTIYVFTPKGDVVELPEDSVPIDFAYRIHSEVGDRTVGAIVNGNIVSLDYKLKDSDIVEIKTMTNSMPKKEWLNIVKTSQAKEKIKSFFNKHEKEKIIESGKASLDRALKRKKITYNEIFTDGNVEILLKDLTLSTFDEVLFNIGSLRYTANYIISLVTEEKKSAQDILLSRISNHEVKPHDEYKEAVIVSGIDNIKVVLAKCCNPVYGEDIIGYVTTGSGIAVHSKTCKNILTMKEKFVDVAWNTLSNKTYYTDIIIDMNDNSSNPISAIISKASVRNISVESFNSEVIRNSLQYIITVKVKSKEDLELFINDIKSIKDVISAKRRSRKCE